LLTQQYQQSPANVSPSTDNGEKIPTFPDTVITMEALYDFKAAEATDLSFIAGDTVKVLHRNQDGWWKVQRISDNAVGVVPTNFFVSKL
jgi:uncharacterized protein YdaL